LVYKYEDRKIIILIFKKILLCLILSTDY
jgi:hypothetical protein